MLRNRQFTKPVLLRLPGDPKDPHWTGPRFIYEIPEIGRAEVIKRKEVENG